MAQPVETTTILNAQSLTVGPGAVQMVYRKNKQAGLLKIVLPCCKVHYSTLPGLMARFRIDSPVFHGNVHIVKVLKMLVNINIFHAKNWSKIQLAFMKETHDFSNFSKRVPCFDVFFKFRI